MLFSTLGAIGTCVDIGLPVGVVCSKESFDDAVAAWFWNELFEIQSRPPEGAM